ncbi:hypothetical protein A3715_07985 [Oleiphilus sp. HI0009]|nr:hypothetical protein A3715_07985 [Oleiphilus sp. HI0009]
MKFPSSRSLTSLGGVVAFVLIAGILVFMARSQDVRALLASWNGFNADQIGIYNQLVKLQSAGELNYDEVSMSLFESANHQQTYRTDLQQYYPYISNEFDAGLAQDFRRFESSVEDFKTQLALTRNSTRFLIQCKTELLSQTNLSDAGKHKLELDIINFALKPTPFNSGAIDRALIQISATYVGDDALLEAFKQHKQKVLEGYSDTLTLIDRIDGLISVSTFNTVAQKLENELAVYSRSVNGFAVSLIALILALLVRVVMLSRRAENAVKELSFVE